MHKRIKGISRILRCLKAQGKRLKQIHSDSYTIFIHLLSKINAINHAFKVKCFLNMAKIKFTHKKIQRVSFLWYQSSNWRLGMGFEYRQILLKIFLKSNVNINISSLVPVTNKKYLKDLSSMLIKIWLRKF